MSTLELKDKLHRLVLETDDPLILKQIVALFASLREEEDWWDLISEEEKKQIEIGARQAAARQVVSWESVQGKARKILDKN